MISARVLVVEDDPRILSVLQRGLRAEGYRVEVARDGLEGLDLARRETFALIVLDRMLPGLEGLEVCARLRREGCPSLIIARPRGGRRQAADRRPPLPGAPGALAEVGGAGLS